MGRLAASSHHELPVEVAFCWHHGLHHQLVIDCDRLGGGVPNPPDPKAGCLSSGLLRNGKGKAVRIRVGAAESGSVHEMSSILEIAGWIRYTPLFSLLFPQTFSTSAKDPCLLLLKLEPYIQWFMGCLIQRRRSQRGKRRGWGSPQCGLETFLYCTESKMA